MQRLGSLPAHTIDRRRTSRSVDERCAAGWPERWGWRSASMIERQWPTGGHPVGPWVGHRARRRVQPREIPRRRGLHGIRIYRGAWSSAPSALLRIDVDVGIGVLHRRRPRSPIPTTGSFTSCFPSRSTCGGLVRQLLGPALARRFDWSTLELVSRNYVNARLGRSACDVLLSVQFRGSRRRALLYVLLEHQRKPDPMMPFRMLRYACRAWEEYVERSDAIEGYLPPIIPLLVHQDPKGMARGPLIVRSSPVRRRERGGTMRTILH